MILLGYEFDLIALLGYGRCTFESRDEAVGARLVDGERRAAGEII